MSPLPHGQDPLGHEVLAQRLASLPQLVEDFLEGVASSESAGDKIDLGHIKEITISGTGSSLAHAQYLAWLLAAVPQLTVRVESFDAFYCGDFVRPARKDESLLVLISQGLSPNAQIVLACRSAFGRTALLTSSTPRGARSSGKEDRAQLLEALAAEGSIVQWFPLENEYEVLVRIVGPLVGYLAAARFAQRLGALIQFPASSVIRLALEMAAECAAEEQGNWSFDALARGSVLLAPTPVSLFGANLIAKFVEGLFVPAPLLCEGLSFAHGGYQFAVGAQVPVVMLGVKRKESPAQFALMEKASEMCLAAGLTPLLIPSSLPLPFAILEYEMTLNAIFLRLMQSAGVAQRSWPGMDLDSALYSLRTGYSLEASDKSR
jgi:hypothetical protein